MNCRSNCTRAVLNILVYIVYRCVRLVVQFESDVIWLVKSVFDRTPYGERCEILSILVRRRFHVGDIARIEDFMGFHDRISSWEELCDPHWMLFTVCERYAYFVHLPFPSHHYNVANAPQLAIAQFYSADGLARLPIERFIMKSNRFRRFSGQVMMISTMARCGTTLLARMLQAADTTGRHVLVFSEPDAFSMVALLLGAYHFSIRRTRRILLAVLRFACKDQLPEQTIVFKMRSNCVRLVPHVHAMAPQVMHTYAGRRSLEDALVSQIAVSKQSDNVLATVLRLHRLHAGFTEWLTTWGTMEWRLMRAIDPCSVLEFALVTVAQSFIDFVHYEQYFAALPIFYEDLMADTVGSMRTLFGVCSISELNLPECIECKRADLHTLRAESIESAKRELGVEERLLLREILSHIAYPIIEPRKANFLSIF